MTRFSTLLRLRTVAACPTIAMTLVASAPATGFAAAPEISEAASEVTWAETLDASALAAHVRAHGADIVLVGAGVGSQELREATRAVRHGLEGAQGVGRVLDADGVGDATEADDATIVQRATLEGVGRVVIVRVDRGPAESTLLLAVYDERGQTVGGFSVARGEAVPEAEARTPGGLALATIEGETVSPNVREYERRRVVFGGGLEVTATGTQSAVVTRALRPHTGAGAPLEHDEFYRYVGREDLAQQYRARRGAKIGLQVAGWGSALAGFTMMIALPLSKVAGGTKCLTIEDPIEQDACDSNHEAEKKHAVRVGVGGGAALAIGGIALAIVGTKLRADKTTAAEAMDMANEYNEGLRKRLRVPPELAFVRVAPTASPSGGGLVMEGRF